MSKLNLRFTHYPSGTPVTELQVDCATTVGQLRTLVEEQLSFEDSCLVRIFSKWYLKVKIGDITRNIELCDNDASHILSAVGIEDESELYLEGPTTVEGKDGLWKAISIMNLRGRQAQNQQRELTQTLIDEVRSLKEYMEKTLSEHSKSHANELQQLTSLVSSNSEQMIDWRQQAVNGFQALKSQLDSLEAQMHIADIESDQANTLLLKYSGMPLKALWEVLNDEESSIELALAIVMDRRCGLERISTLAEGEMKSNNGWAFNKEKGGLTPMIMTALAGRVDVMKALLAAGADKDAIEDQHNLSALHVSAYTNNPSAIELLASYGADVNPGGFSPLHQAALHGHLEAIEILISKGADKTKVNRDGKTPLKIFGEKEFTGMTIAVKDRIRKVLALK